MNAVVFKGTDKHAARVLGLSPKTIEYHMRSARKKMGALNRLCVAIAWDRFTRCPIDWKTNPPHQQGANHGCA